ncbi:MAG TPA: hypothetical protein VEV21_11820 [Burkholderiales bacterium]|nr:hypothetical protein [Burkholderiales bacterium]
MKVQVQCRRMGGAELPAGFRLGERFLRVVRVTQQRTEGRNRYFRITVLDGREFELRQDVATNDWELERVVAKPRNAS